MIHIYLDTVCTFKVSHSQASCQHNLISSCASITGSVGFPEHWPVELVPVVVPVWLRIEWKHEPKREISRKWRTILKWMSWCLFPLHSITVGKLRLRLEKADTLLSQRWWWINPVINCTLSLFYTSWLHVKIRSTPWYDLVSFTNLYWFVCCVAEIILITFASRQ